MAKRRKTAAKKKAVAKKFITLYSECGDVSQLSDLTGESYPSVAAAKTAIDKWVADGYSDGCCVVAEIHDVAKASGITWTGKTSL